MAIPVPAGAGDLAQQIILLNEYADASNIGVVISSMLYGIFLVQIYTYADLNTKRPDSWKLRLLVAWVFSVATAHTVCLWVYFVTNLRRARFNPLELLGLDPWLALTYWMSGIMGSSVQSFYAYRVYRLSGKLYLSMIPWVGSFARAGLATVALVFAFETHDIVTFMDKYGWALKGVFGASVGVDVVNTIFVCVILARRRGDQEFTKRMIDKLIFWTIETGAVTTALAVMMLTLIVIGRYSMLPGAIHIYPNMFSLSLLLTLNARDAMRKTIMSSRSQGHTPSTTFKVAASQSERPFNRGHNHTESLPMDKITATGGTEVMVYTETIQTYGYRSHFDADSRSDVTDRQRGIAY